MAESIFSPWNPTSLLWLLLHSAKKRGKKITCKELGNRVWKVSAIQEILPAGFNYSLQLNSPPFFELQTYNNMTFIECASYCSRTDSKSPENCVVYNQLLKYTLYTRLIRVLWRKHILSVCITKYQLLKEEHLQSAASRAGDLLQSSHHAHGIAAKPLLSPILGARTNRPCPLPSQPPQILASQ